MRGSPKFDAAFASLRPRQNRHPHAPLARPLRGPVTLDPTRSSVGIRLNEQTEVHMYVQTARTQAWLAEFASIQAEIAAHGMPKRAPLPVVKRTRKLKPLWEE